MRRKIAAVIGLFAILIGINMQVNALNPADGIAGKTHRVNTQQSLDEWMPDKELQDALVSAMKLKDTSELTQQILENYDGSLDISAHRITNIKGLEYAKATTVINLGGNRFNDLSPLGSLRNLKHLELKYGEVSDISPLAGLTSLEILDISSNKVSDLKPLQGLNNLKKIIFNYNQITDLTVLQDMASLKVLEGTMQGAYNSEVLTGEVDEIIKQKNNFLSFDGSKPELGPFRTTIGFVKYDKGDDTIWWQFDKPDKRVEGTKFNINKSYHGVVVRFGGSVMQPIRITGDATSLTVKDTEIYVGDKWEPHDNLVEATNQDGEPVGLDTGDVGADGWVDSKTPGIYTVTYTIHNAKNEPITKEAKVTVIEDKTSIEVKDNQLFVTDEWNKADNFVSATDKDGKTLTIENVMVDGNVNTSKEGTYEVTYSVLDHAQNKVSKTAKIYVYADQTSLEVRDSRLYLNEKWNPADNLVKATDKDGKDLDIKDITIEGDVDTANEGIYKVKYIVLNHKNEKITKEATITVKGIDLTALEVKGSVLYLNEQWNPQDNIVKAIDQDGNKIDIKDIVIDGEVNTKVANDYNVKFTIFNHKKEPVVRATIVKVKEDLTSLEVKDSVLYFGDRWQPEDNLVKATDKDGNPLDIYDIKVEGDVDIKTAGDYPVKYTVLNNAKEKISKIAIITMKGHDYTYLEVEDSTLYVGDIWNPADNLIKARDKDGNELGIEDVIVEGDVNTSEPGTYEIVYALLNHNNDKLSNIATITVKDDQTNLKVKNSIIYLEDQWNPADNLVEATDKDGQNIDLKDILVDSDVDTTKTGIYKVKYTIVNHKDEKVTLTATIIVKKDHTSIEVKDSTLYLSDPWNPEDNLVKAIDKDGKAISIKNIKVVGKADTTQVGVYQVTYTIYNHKKEKVSDLANITVKEDKTSLIVKDSALYLDDEWKATDNIVEAIDKDGNVIEDIAIIAPQVDDKEAKAKVIVEGNVDTRSEGVSKLTYTILDHANIKITKDVAINVKLDKTSLQVRDTIISLNSKWQPANNLVRAMNQDGKVLNIKDVTVEGKVNTRKAGKYKITYTIMNHADKKISKKATVTVQKKSNGDGNGKLPKTGYDMSIIGSLLGLAGILGFGSLYLNRRERKE